MWTTGSDCIHPYPKLVLGAPVEILNGAGEFVTVVAHLEAVSLG